MKLVSSMIALAILALSNHIFAETAPGTGKTKGDPAKGQQIATQVCAGCHNPDGNSVIPTNPSLAGQHAEYITKQLENFKSQEGKPPERASPIMGAMVAPLSAEDMKNLGAYYAQQVPKPVGAKDKPLAEQGEKIYRGGNLETGVPACAGCHSPNGVGIPPSYPRIAGQHGEYVLAQLRAFRTEERTKDPNNVMHMIASRMSEREMRTVSEFIAGLR
ncbi:c-type cytochrome [Nitrosovibrio tenuis]|uniref:Cytochrome c553 n=1 Tax=Nitrosovibrio tenuis TaxID=1233 RepID=A0A1H7R5E9_9PROT|nr:Cytochrome c553 [Nitrosovibrio tenuis]